MKLRHGQAALEYVLATAAMITVVVAMGCVVSAVYRYSNRTTALIRTNTP